jgi:D-glycero-D-manno-heptose 1,7-bisphosphate phosphatase
MTRIKTVLLDRDGTIIYNRHYLSDPDDIEFLPGAVEGLRQMRDLGLRMVLITNQSGIGRGYFTEERLREIHDRFEAMLAEEGVRLDGIYFCPATPDDDSDCRKPRTGMVDKAARELGFDIQGAVMIGDSAADIGLARNLGIPGLFVPGQYELPEDVSATATVADLVEAVHFIRDYTG